MCDPPTWDFGAEFLPLEIEVRRHGGIRSEKIEGGGGGERPIEEIIGRSGVGQSHAQGCAVKKVVKPAGRKRLVGYVPLVIEPAG
jgi:hypothetical protein